MKPRLLLAGSSLLLLALARPVSAEVHDLADLVPAHSLAYVELHDPPRLARELHALVKGSYLQNPAAFLAHPLNNQGKKKNEEASLLAWLGSSEFIDELGDWQGGCLALTGFWNPDDPEPEIVAVLRTGKSRMFPLVLRMVLLEGGDLRCIGRVEGVPIFQIGKAETRKRPEIARRVTNPARQLVRLLRGPHVPVTYPVARLEDVPVEEPEEKPEWGCFLSLMPGALAVGTTPESLADTIRRLKGKSSSPSLATVPAFRAAAARRNRPGLFAWSDPPHLTRWFNDLLHRELIRKQDEIRHRPRTKGEKRDPAKLREELRQAEEQQRRENQEWFFFQTLANPAGMNYAAAGWYLHDGEFACYADVRMKEKQTSQLLELLPAEKISPEFLRAVPGDAFGLFALPLPDGADTLARLVKLADAYTAVADDKSPSPSKALHELEKQMKLRLGRDVLAKIKSAGVAVHLVCQDEKEVSIYPLLVIEASSEEAAKALESVLPRLYGSGDKAAEPKPHTLDGQCVHSLTETAADPDLAGPPPHYGRRGKFLVLGWHRGGVAAALRDSGRKKDLLNLPRGLATVDAEGPVSAIGLFSGRQLLGHLAAIGSTRANQSSGDLRALRYLREMSTPMAAMPPTVFAVQRLPDGVRVELRQSELPAASATVVDIALTWLLDEAAGGGMNIRNGLMRFLAAQAPPPPGAGALVGAAIGGGVGALAPP